MLLELPMKYARTQQWFERKDLPAFQSVYNILQYFFI
jgi:hypothetical protein